MGIFDAFKKKKEQKETRPDFGNVKGGSSTTSPPQEQAPKRVETAYTEYLVVKGDSLSLIAQRLYGDMHAWRRIYEANRDVIDDPDKIHPGQVLKIPKHHPDSV